MTKPFTSAVLHHSARLDLLVVMKLKAAADILFVRPALNPVESDFEFR